MAANKKLTKLFTEIADSIREVDSSVGKIAASEFSAKIKSLKEEKPVVALKDYNFFDYDGTLLYSYTYEEAMSLSDMPILPIHKGLKSIGWNFTLEQMRVQGTRKCDIGAMYVTDDGSTRLHISVETLQAYTMYFYQEIEGATTIDWGDGSPLETVEDFGQITVNHDYKQGNYVITIYVKGGFNIGLGNKLTGKGLYGQSNSSYDLSSARTLIKVERGERTSFLPNCFVSCVNLKAVTSIKNDGEYTLENTSIAIGIIPANAAAYSSTFSNSGYSIKRFSVGFNTICPTAYGAITYLVLPYGVESMPSIQSYTISEIYFPKTIRTVGASIVKKTDLSLLDFSSLRNIPTLSNTSILSGISTKCEIRVPEDLYDEWVVATNWVNYADNIKPYPRLTLE